MFSHLIRAIKQEPKSLLIIDKMIADWPLLGTMLLVVEESSPSASTPDADERSPALHLVPDSFTSTLIETRFPDAVIACSISSIVDGYPDFLIGDLSVVSYLSSCYE